MFENIRLAFQGIWSHKLRSILTMLGIIIGIAAIITIVSTIEGTNEQIKENLIGAGNNVVTVQLNQSGYPYDMSWSSIPEGVRIITEQTRQELEQIDAEDMVASRQSAFGVEVLVKDRALCQRKYPKMVVEQTTLEEIMIFYVGNQFAENGAKQEA